MNLISRLLTTNRWLTYALVVLLSVPPILGVLDIRFPGVKKGTRPVWFYEKEQAELWSTQEAFKFSGLSCIVVLECDDFFQAKRIAAIRETVVKLQSVRGLNLVTWLGQIPQVTLFGTRQLLPDEVTDDEGLKSIEDSIREHPLVKGQLLSDDGHTMLLFMDSFNIDVHESIRTICREQLEPVGVKSRLTGAAPLHFAREIGFDNEHARILLTAMALVVVLALIIFRGMSAILVVCSGPGLGVFWTIGWLGFIGDPGNELTNIMLPVMILIIGFTDSVHFVVHIRQERVRRDQQSGDSSTSLDRQQAAHALSALQTETAASAIRHIGMACLLTSLTTAIGFGSLMIADAPVVFDFGRASAIGVLVTFVAILLVVPLVSSSWIGRRIHVGYERDLVGRHMQKLSGMMAWIVAQRKLVGVFGVLATIGLTMQAMTLTPDDRLIHRVPNSSDAYQAMVHVDRTLGGTRFALVQIKWTNDATNEEIWDVVSEVDQIIETDPLFSSPVSVQKWVSVLPGGHGPKKLHVIGMIPDEFRTLFWQPHEKQTLVITRVQDLGVATYEPVVKEMKVKFDGIKQQHPDFNFTVVAELFVTSGFVKNVVHELFKSLLLAGVIIFVVITIAFRSIRLGLLSVIPNLFPLVATAAIRSMIDSSLDVASACSFAICLGIAVDDTIHFLSRYQLERKLGYPVDEAINRGFMTVGSALVMTTLVMMAGFVTVMTSSLPTHSLFGAMSTATIATALFGDLVILPALLAWFPGRSASEKTIVMSEDTTHVEPTR